MGKKRHTRTKSANSRSLPAGEHFRESSPAVTATQSSTQSGSSTARAAGDSESSEPQVPGTPTPGLQALFSIAVLIQFGGLYLALSANLFQSRLQQELMAFAAPYLVTTGQQYGTQPLEMTHAEAFDLPLQVEVQTEDNDDWTPLPITLGRQSSRWPNLARRLRLIIEDDTESEILADFAHQFAANWEQLDGSNPILAIRYVQPFAPNFDEGSALAEGRGGLLDVDAEVLYSATAIRNGSSLVGFVPSQESYRSSKATKRKSL